jgi:glycerol-3-phosphate acyltransferase PlsX
MFLGLTGIAVKSHGSTDAFGFANAIGVAADVKRYELLEKIIDEMARLNATPTGNGPGIVAASI